VDLSQPHPGLLFYIPLVLGFEALTAAVMFARKAPALSIGLVAAILAGVARFLIDPGPHGVPANVTIWSSVGLIVGGLVSLLATRGRPPAASLRRWGFAFLAMAPVAAILLGLVLVTLCPPYTGRSYCSFGDQDLLGGWVTGVAVAFFCDLVFIAGILFVSSFQAAGVSSVSASE
jgi:hypothetical protein